MLTGTTGAGAQTLILTQNIFCMLLETARLSESREKLTAVVNRPGTVVHESTRSHRQCDGADKD